MEETIHRQESIEDAAPFKHRDEAENQAVQDMGYEPVYRRAFSSLSGAAMAFAMASPMSALLVIIVYQVFNAGYWGLTWGWFIPSLLFLPVAVAVAELASSMPINGAFYWWTAALAPRRYSRIAAFCVGWVIAIANMVSISSFSFAMASNLSIIIPYLQPSFAATQSQLMGIAYAVICVWFVLSLLRVERLTKVFVGCAIVSFSTSVVIIIALPAVTAHNGTGFAPASKVFGSFTNYSGWVDSIAVPSAWFSVAWAVTGWSTPAYIAEETQDARRAVPRAIISSFSLMAAIGMVVCLIVAFCIPNMEAFALDPSGLPMFTLLRDTWGPKSAFAFCIITWLAVVFGGSGIITAYSCQLSAFARDGGLPFGEFFSRVHAYSNLPLPAAILLTGGSMLILLFSLSPIASRIIYSLAVIAMLCVQIIPMAFRIFAGKRFIPGPFSLGKLSIPVHSYAVIFQLYMIIMQCFPPAPVFTAATFNYNWVFCLGVVAFIVLVWFAIGKKRFAGLNISALDGSSAAELNYGNGGEGLGSYGSGSDGKRPKVDSLSQS